MCTIVHSTEGMLGTIGTELVLADDGGTAGEQLRITLALQGNVINAARTRSIQDCTACGIFAKGLGAMPLALFFFFIEPTLFSAQIFTAIPPKHVNVRQIAPFAGLSIHLL